jgi:hypothetical protein
MHNQYMNSLEWMPQELRERYDDLKQNKGKGKTKQSKGKGKGKRDKDTAHKLKKERFNVCFFKAFGSKQLFWHLVKVGPDNQDLPELLFVWADLKSTTTYRRLVEVSMERSAEETELKNRVERCRVQVYNARHGMSKKVIDEAVAAHEAAKSNWKNLNRNMAGMHELLVANISHHW